MPVNHGRGGDPVFELNAHAFAAAQFQRRTEIARGREQCVPTTAYHLTDVAQAESFRARPQRNMGRCGNQLQDEIRRIPGRERATRHCERRPQGANAFQHIASRRYE
ncbi:MAG TPA: hypothetical protein VFK60_12025 [Casimicrobiaceae bacterium]|nr:hypothetical protein [Casimicrobiaceae bacterium]